MRMHYYCPPDDLDVPFSDIETGVTIEAGQDIDGLCVSTVKKLIKRYGGGGYTLHCDRSGSVFETSAIKLSGNNSRFKYNRHL